MIRILGIDPGSRITGYGIIDTEGNHLQHIANDRICPSNENLASKLGDIFNGIDRVITQYQPDEVSIEKIFMHRNADSALKLGQARGVAITACAVRNIDVFEYSANQVKQATVGKGHAAKQQVQHMVKILLCLSETPSADAADALAVAICHSHWREGLSRMPGVGALRRNR